MNNTKITLDIGQNIMEKLDGEDGSVLAESRSDVALVSADEEGSAGADGQKDDRPAWDSKLQYVLTQVGFSVGLGNVWRFPYLCHQNGGGAFMLLYVMLLLIIGVPLFFMELAAGQCIRQGSIGVWKHISPHLAGIGYSSCMVCFFVALYYNVIIAWSLFYMGNSFQYPLPWEQCPVDMISNQTVLITRTCCHQSSHTTNTHTAALDISDSIDQSGEFNPIMTGCLLAAWAIVCLAMIKGIKSSAKVMYFSSVFPYAVLICFLIRGLMLDGAIEGIKYMFYPKLEIWGEVQVWCQAATQVFFALGLGYGSVIAYSSYNPVHNNCNRDAIMVSGINFMTSVLASLVVFVVLGFRAKNIALDCSSQHWWPWFNMSDPKLVALQDYREWYSHYGSLLGSNITDLEATGLAFIAFTEAMALFPASPFWSTLFFLMLLNLGLSTMFGTMQGILTPTSGLCSCILGFFIGLLFTQRSGNYFVTMLDDYSATLPLIIVVVFETVSVAWIYGADRFLDDVEVMLHWRPPVVYVYLWKYVGLLGMVGLLAASLLCIVFKRPTYTAWNHTTGSETSLEYPGWALVMLSMLIIVAFLPVPIGYLLSFLRGGQSLPVEEGEVEPPRERYSKCNSAEPEPNNHHSPLDEDRNRPCSTFLPLGAEHYMLLPQQEDGEEEEDTGL
uniref:Transporter n=1 Tax=Sinocyclocheilus anshuiensis TaxID=1608454 RepID=A0A671SIB3_9TELE